MELFHILITSYLLNVPVLKYRTIVLILYNDRVFPTGCILWFFKHIVNQSTRKKVFIYQLLNTTSFSLVFPVLVVSKMLHKMEIMSTLLMCACVISYLFIVVRMWNKQSCLCKSSLNSLLEPFEAFSNDGKSLLIYESMRAFDGVRTQTSLTTSPRRPTKNKFSITLYGIQITSVLSSSRLHCVEWTYTKFAKQHHAYINACHTTHEEYSTDFRLE